MKELTKRLDENGIAMIAAGVVVGFAAWNLIDGFIRCLVAPLIAAFIGNSVFQLNSFSANGSDFYYGAFLEDVFAFGVVILLLSMAVPAVWDHVRRRIVHSATDSSEPS